MESQTSHGDDFFHEMISVAHENFERNKHGFRYTIEMKLYAAYVRMIGGRLMYETFKANCNHAVPSLRSVDRYISQVQSHISEGVLRSNELLKYLNDLQLPKIVALSEDATRITGRIQYDPKTNQLIGFVLPLGQNGMPIHDTNKAISASEIEKCFFNTKTGKEKKRSSYFNVIMAQPLVVGIPAFCLLAFGTDATYTSEDIKNRWQYIKNELNECGIHVVTFASDSDPKFNSTMKYHINLGQNLSGNDIDFPQWFNAELCYSSNYLPIQDTIHIGTKMRNRILNRTLKMGSNVVSVEHLSKLLTSFSKEKHGLCLSTIKPIDRQNFESVLKICSEKVIGLLHNVKESRGTILYLKVLNSILKSFLDLRLSPLERVRHTWFSIFVLRIWKRFILESGQKYSTEEDFISANCYACIEINGHSLVYLMLWLKERKLEHLFQPQMLGSQQCESIFRQIRSLSSTFSTVTNCSVLDIMHRMSKIELQNQISHFELKHWKFPRIGLPSSSYFPTTDRNGKNRIGAPVQLPTKEEIISEIELAKIEAIEYSESLGMFLNDPKNYVCTFPKKQKKQQKQTIPDIGNSSFETEGRSENNLQLFSDVNFKPYSIKIDSEFITETSQYVKIRNKDGEILCVKKHMLCWFLSSTTSKLSSDRLRRVMAKKEN